MSSISFRFRPIDKNKPVKDKHKKRPVYCRIRVKGIEHVFNTREIGHPLNIVKGKWVLPPKEFDVTYDIGMRLMEMERYIHEQIVRKGEVNVTKEFLSMIVLDYFNKIEKLTLPQATRYDTFVGWVYNFAYNVAPTKRYLGNKIAPRTVLSYMTTFKKLKEFDEYCQKSHKPNEIDQNYYDSFLAFMEDELLITNLNTQGEAIRNIKTFLRQLAREDYEIHPFIKDNNFVIRREKALTVSLDENELRQLINVKFPDNLSEKRLKNLKNIRDLFVIGCKTGLRFSDFTRLTADHIDETGKYITIVQKKTGKSINIGFGDDSTVKEILTERPTFKVGSTAFNKNIKLICKYAGITKTINGKVVEVVEIEGKKYKRLGKARSMAKYHMITSHSARRTFATIAYRRKVPVAYIMNITGHQNTKTFFAYIAIVDKTRADDFTRIFDANAPEIK